MPTSRETSHAKQGMTSGVKNNQIECPLIPKEDSLVRQPSRVEHATQVKKTTQVTPSRGTKAVHSSRKQSHASMTQNNAVEEPKGSLIDEFKELNAQVSSNDLKIKVLKEQLLHSKGNIHDNMKNMREVLTKTRQARQALELNEHDNQALIQEENQLKELQTKLTNALERGDRRRHLKDIETVMQKTEKKKSETLSRLENCFELCLKRSENLVLQMRSQVNDVEEEMTRVEEAVQIKKHEILAVKQEHLNEKWKFEDTLKELEDQEVIKSLKNTIKDNEEELESLKQQLKTVTEHDQEVQVKVDSFSEINSNIQDKVVSLNSEIKDMQDECLEEEIRGLEEKMKEVGLKEDLMSLNREQDLKLLFLSDNLSSLQHDLKVKRLNLQEELKIKTDQDKRVSDQVKETEAKIKSLEERLSILIQEKEDLESQKKTRSLRESKLQEVLQDLARLEEQVRRQEEDKASAETDLRSVTESLQRLESQKREKEDNLKTMEKELQDKSKEVEEKQKVRDSIEKLENIVLEKKSSLIKDRQKIIDLKSSIMRAEKTHQDIVQRLKKEDSQERLRVSSKNIQDLKTQKEMKKAKLDIIQSSLKKREGLPKSSLSQPVLKSSLFTLKSSSQARLQDILKTRIYVSQPCSNAEVKPETLEASRSLVVKKEEKKETQSKSQPKKRKK